MPCFGVLIIRILLFRVLYSGPLFSETPILDGDDHEDACDGDQFQDQKMTVVVRTVAVIKRWADAGGHAGHCHDCSDDDVEEDDDDADDDDDDDDDDADDNNDG